MDKMSLLTATVVMMAMASPARADVDQWQGFIAEAAQRFAIPEPWIRAVMKAESAGRTTLDGQPVTSKAGAMGLMQVMPNTYAEMQRKLNLGSDPYDPHDNILAGTAYLRAMFDHYGYPGLFAAYNAGLGRYEQSLQGRSLPAETQAYLASVAKVHPKPPSGHALFITLSASPVTLFVPLTTVSGAGK